MLKSDTVEEEINVNLCIHYSSYTGGNARRLGSVQRTTKYEIDILKDIYREKLLDFFIALRREFEDEDILTQCRPLILGGVTRF